MKLKHGVGLSPGWVGAVRGEGGPARGQPGDGAAAGAAAACADRGAGARGGEAGHALPLAQQLQGDLLQQPGGEQGELPGRGAVRGPGHQPRRVAVLPLPPPRDHAGRPRRPGPGPRSRLALGCLLQIKGLQNIQIQSFYSIVVQRAPH